MAPPIQSRAQNETRSRSEIRLCSQPPAIPGRNLLLMMAAVASKDPNSTSMFPCRGPSSVDGLPNGNIIFIDHLYLYRGFFSVSHYSDILRTPPEVPEPKDGHFRCIKHWKKMWEKPQRQEGTGPRSDFPDPLGVLKSLATFNPSQENSKSHLNPEYCNCYFKAEAAAFLQTPG